MTIVLDHFPEVQAHRSLDAVLSRLGLVKTDVSMDAVRFLTISAEICNRDLSRAAWRGPPG